MDSSVVITCIVIFAILICIAIAVPTGDGKGSVEVSRGNETSAPVAVPLAQWRGMSRINPQGHRLLLLSSLQQPVATGLGRQQCDRQ